MFQIGEWRLLNADFSDSHESSMSIQLSPEQPRAVLKSGILSLIVVLGAEILNLGLRDIQLRLRQLDDRCKPQIVAPLRQIQGQRGLAEKLCGNVDPLKSIHSAGPCHADVSSYTLLYIAKSLVSLIGSIPGRLAARRE